MANGVIINDYPGMVARIDHVNGNMLHLLVTHGPVKLRRHVLTTTDVELSI